MKLSLWLGVFDEVVAVHGGVAATPDEEGVGHFGLAFIIPKSVSNYTLRIAMPLVIPTIRLIWFTIAIIPIVQVFERMDLLAEHVFIVCCNHLIAAFRSSTGCWSCSCLFWEIVPIRYSMPVQLSSISGAHQSERNSKQIFHFFLFFLW